MTTITEPGLYYDLAPEDYHAQTDWLSWSMMKNLLPPLTPAHFKAALTAKRIEKRVWDLGKVVHRIALGAGDEYQVVMALNKQKDPYEATDYSTVSSQVDRDRIYAAGKVPILRAELDAAHDMAASLKAHHSASVLLRNGSPEVSLFWIDPDTGVRCRARIDWLPNPVPGLRLIVPDVKTDMSAAPTVWAKSAANYGYFGQATHYSDGIKALGLDPDPAFVFAVVEKSPPYLPAVHQLTNPDDVKLARAAVDHCRRLYAECMASDRWPGYSDQITTVTLPPWWRYQLEEGLSA